MTFKELAWSFIEVYEELDVDQINQVLHNNTPPEALEFFFAYAEKIRTEEGLVDDEKGSDRLAELMLLGYLIHGLETQLRPKTQPAGWTKASGDRAARESEGSPR
ncbi:MAG: hypothetical protein VX574_06600 [Myxococcota bacterium]|nr:hypothetical protein [Myxococcota bacterium]